MRVGGDANTFFRRGPCFGILGPRSTCIQESCYNAVQQEPDMRKCGTTLGLGRRRSGHAARGEERMRVGGDANTFGSTDMFSD
jgi:hypothetical protein